MTTIISLLKEQTVFSNLQAESKKEVLTKLIESFREHVNEKDLRAIREAVFEREKIMSTGVGKGLAIPHGKAEGLKESYAAFALLETPVSYEAIDDEPVKMVFLLVGPKSSNSMHIKMLSRISRLMNNSGFREKLQQCGSSEEVIHVFEEGEKNHFREGA